MNFWCFLVTPVPLCMIYVCTHVRMYMDIKSHCLSQKSPKNRVESGKRGQICCTLVPAMPMKDKWSTSATAQH